MQFQSSTLPAELTPDSVAKWVEENFLTLARAMAEQSEVELRPIYAPPSNPREGMIVYADGTEWNPGSGKGVYVFTGAAWSKL